MSKTPASPPITLLGAQQWSSPHGGGAARERGALHGVVSLAVADVDRALAFYTEKAGFALDVDYAPTDEFRVVQLTPPGSGCSVQIGIGLTDAAAGSMRGVCAVVQDLEAVRAELVERGVPVGEIRHKSPLEDWRGGWEPGLDPGRTDYASFADFTDPDGNQWVLQERGHRE